MRSDVLQSLIDKLVERIDIERIYQFAFPDESGDTPLNKQLLLVVNPVKGMAPNAFAPLVSLCMSDLQEEMPFDMIITGEWSNRVKQGSLYHTYISLPQHLCYARQSKPNVLLSGKNINGLLDLAQLHYHKAREISDDFLLGAGNFIAKGDYTQATYMLHQFMETRVRAFQEAVGSNTSKGHNLEQKFKTIKSALPKVQEIFKYDEFQTDLLRKLDQGYVKTLKQQPLEIQKEEFDVLLQKCQSIAHEMDNRVGLMLHGIKQYCAQKATEKEASQSKEANTVLTSENTKTNNLGVPPPTEVIICEDFSSFPWPDAYKKDANALLSKIRKSHNPEQITMLNYHTGGFSGQSLFQQAQEESEGTKVELFLVVMMKNTGPFHFKCIQVGVASAMVLYLNVSSIEHQLSVGNRFVHTLWTKGHVLRRKSTFEPNFSVAEVDWEKETKEIEEIVDNAKTCMHNLYELLNSAHPTKMDTAFLLLRNLYDIGVSTINRCAIGFEPAYMALVEQIDWTGLYDRCVIDYIYPDDDVAEARLTLIFNQRSVWWQNKKSKISMVSKPEYRAVAREITQFFAKQFDKIVLQIKQSVPPKIDSPENTQ